MGDWAFQCQDLWDCKGQGPQKDNIKSKLITGCINFQFLHKSIRCRHQEIITIKRFDVGKDFTTCGLSNLKVLPSGIEICVKNNLKTDD